ncbi:MAG: hypothetical protein ABFS32_23645, partial [Bacteroidota bacterium]
VTIAATHPLVRYNQFLSRMGFPRLWIYLGTTGITFNPNCFDNRKIFRENLYLILSVLIQIN